MMKNYILILFLALLSLISMGKSDYTTPSYGNIRLTQDDLPPFSEDVFSGYTTEEQLKEDLRILGLKYAEAVINQAYYYGAIIEEEFVTTASDSADSFALNEKQSADVTPGDYETNNQVQGVDEADVVKSDGHFIYLGYSDKVIVHDLGGNIIWEQKLNVSNVADLLLSNNKLLVIANEPFGYYNYHLATNSKLFIFAIKPDGKLSLIEDKEIVGYYNNAREINGNVYLTASSPLNSHFFYSKLSYYYGDYNNMPIWLYRQIAAAKAPELVKEWVENIYQHFFSNDSMELQNIIRLNSMKQTINEKSYTRSPYVWPPVNSLITIYAFNIDRGLGEISKTSTFSTSNHWTLHMYANHETMVIANTGWTIDGWSWLPSTNLYTFSLQNGRIIPQAAGSVEGSLLNQFSMDIHKGYLRVATTVNQQWDYNRTEGWHIKSQSNNFVSVLKTQNRSLEVVGKAGDLGKGERIYSVRFLGDTAYVVTFRQTDPFYTLDLSRPEKPEIRGELKIPGFSNYLHPIGKDYVIALGRDASLEGRVQGMQVALFDVRDLSDPKQIYKHIIDPSRWSHSEALWDHHAFRYVQSKELLLIPYISHRYDKGTYEISEGFKLFTVSPDKGISDYGNISMEDTYVENYYNYFKNSYLKGRSMVFGNDVVTIMGRTVASFNYSDLSKNWETRLPDNKE